MTLIEAMEIKAAFTGAMTFAGYGGKSRRKALAEPAERYSEQQLAEAYAASSTMNKRHCAQCSSLQ
ncbi:MAG: hypothetical protein Pg6C_16600 [Treponemataceae bacterium]|nr:MAG: hypothetical protein Pg6C_16600 [Treponemataceae bacterium]